jgi:hypothetical protein
MTRGDLNIANQPTIGRRDMLRAAGRLLILAPISGVLVQCSPDEAVEKGAGFRAFSTEEAELLAGFAEALVPGAAKMGVAHFVDHHVSVAPEDSLLSLRYADVPPPYLSFYRTGLAALKAAAGSRPSQGQWSALARTMLTSSIAEWNGPPVELFYDVIRSDAIDCVYATMAGFERLGIEYMAHILPETDW